MELAEKAEHLTGGIRRDQEQSAGAVPLWPRVALGGLSDEDVLNDVGFLDSGEAYIQATKLVRELLVINAQAAKYCSV